MTLADQVALSPDPEAVELVAQKPARLLKQALRLWRTRIGVVLAGGVLLIALFGPYVAPHGPADFVGAPNASSPGFFGTDHLGQDVWSRFLHGGRSILWIASAATAIGIISGALVGLVAAYSRNTLDDVLMRAMDVIMAFPQIMLALVAVSLLGASNWLIIAAIALTTAPRVARVARGAAQPVVERDFVEATESMGLSRVRILSGELFPNILGPMMVEASTLSHRERLRRALTSIRFAQGRGPSMSSSGLQASHT